jgi:NAD(P)-dependent dehydrogenase (short-subunit alcohol dehydrogenase family)
MGRADDEPLAGSRLVVVTGGGKGIGRAIVRHFASLGDRVIAIARDESALLGTTEELRADGREVAYEVCDVTVEGSVAALFERLGAVDVLINNAGTSTSAPVHRATLDEWNRQIAVNATGAFLCTRAVLPSMNDRDRGRIVFVASTAGVVGHPYTAGYVASKHAEVGLMRAVAAEVAGTGITANAVCPTFVRTEMTDRSIERIVQKTGRTVDEAREALASSSPLKRLLEPDEIAVVTAFLASPEAAAINGQVLVMDGGGIQR